MRAALALCCVLACGCGYVGDPLPPALRIPQQIRDLSVREVGDRIVIAFTTPKLTTEDLALKDVEPPEILVNGERLPLDEPPPDHAVYEVPAANYVGHTVTVRARMVARGKPGNWTDQITIPVVAPLAPPADFQADSDPHGVKLTWRGEPRPGIRYDVFRRTPADKEPVSAGTATDQSFVDTTAEFGKSYEYTLRAVLEHAVSEDAGPVTIVPEDRFPPAVPAGLSAVVGVSSIELAWDRNTDADFGSYRVYRAVKGEPAQVLADAVQGPAYSDRQVEPGKTYVYSVSALDQRGNESARSQPVEASAQGSH